ncbi:hypothetical protein NDU88_002315 [Pleurodeles waltl]|uniref:Uncharacterized protein n=1 Tax=Pleurodeles waltl TaxID=8319 RepID=A0AAV7L3A4_PLEWA|nr:hypothetical protein NDU88_002315 [Pleurodeles waltl]
MSRMAKCKKQNESSNSEDVEMLTEKDWLWENDITEDCEQVKEKDAIDVCEQMNEEETLEELGLEGLKREIAVGKEVEGEE